MAHLNSGDDGPVAMANPVSAGMRRYALVLLFLAYVINYIDRQIVTILQEPIKAELGLSDTQLGLMTGLSFALFYAVLGIPIARLADRRSRKSIIGWSILLWSGMTALCATAGSYVSLLAFRVGVGVGEAGLSPPAHSMISDLYPPRKRAAALAFYSTGIQVGVMIGFLAGGWISHYFGWRTAFLIVGIPGLFLAALIALTLPEPPRGLYDGAADETSQRDASLSVLATLRRLWGIRTFRYVSLAAGLHGFVLYGHGNWMPSFLARQYGMDGAEIGTWLALLAVIPGALGIFVSGHIADWLSRWGQDARLWAPIGSVALLIPANIAMLTSGDEVTYLPFAVVHYFLGGVYLAPCIAICHSVVSPTLRASASALFLLMLNLIGLGGGPVTVGLLSDYWGAGSGAGLQMAMIAILPLQALAIYSLWRARVAMRQAAVPQPEID